MNNKKRIIKILKNVKTEVKKILGDKFVDLILFGSYSRGDFTEYSDVDVLILVKNELIRKEKEKIDDLTAKHSLKHDILISCIVYPLKIFEEYNTPFLLSVKEEGIRV